MKFEKLSKELQVRLSNLKEELQNELLNIATTEQELEVSLTLVEAVMEEVETLNDLTVQYRNLKHIRQRALFIQENVMGSVLGVLNVDNLIKYQDKFLETMDFEESFVNPLPLILASLDKDLIIFQDTEGFVKDNKFIIDSFIEKSLNREGLQDYSNNKLSYIDLKKKLCNSGFSKVPIKLYPKIKKSFKGDIDPIKIENFVAEHNREESQKFWDEHKEELLKFKPSLKNFTYKSMVEEYFEGFKLTEGLNSAKLSKQLSKQGFKATDKELQYFGEVKDYFDSFYKKGLSYTLSHLKDVRLFLVDTENFNIPELVDGWAFAGSCHKLDGAGQDSHFAMDYLGFSFLKAYNPGIQKRTGKLYLKNLYRSYFFKKDNEIAHAGGYSNIITDANKTAYEFTSVLYCLLFGRKIDDFKPIEGAHIPEGEFYNGDDGRSLRLWCNMSRKNSYTTLGTSEILDKVKFTGSDVNDTKNCYDVVKELSQGQIEELKQMYVYVN